MRTLKLAWAATWRIVILLVTWAALTSGLVLPVLSKYSVRGAPLSPVLRVYVESVSLLTLLLATWLMLRFIDHRPFRSLGFALRYALRDTVGGLTIGVGMMVACIAVLYAGNWAHPVANATFAASALGLAAIAMVANTITQEVMVRGYVQQTIQLRFGAVNGIIFSALFFLLLHLGAIRGAILPMVSLFAAGILLGTAYVASGNLWLPIALHFGWNFLQGPVLGEKVSGQTLDAGSHLFEVAGPPIITGATFGIEGGLVAIVVTTLGTPLVLLAYRRRINSSLSLSTET